MVENNEVYLCLHLTENEHYVVEGILRNKFNVVYYRKLKDGHIPMYREVKILAKKHEVENFFASNEVMLTEHVEPNPWRDKTFKGKPIRVVGHTLVSYIED